MNVLQMKVMKMDHTLMMILEIILMIDIVIHQIVIVNIQKVTIIHIIVIIITKMLKALKVIHGYMTNKVFQELQVILKEKENLHPSRVLKHPILPHMVIWDLVQELDSKTIKMMLEIVGPTMLILKEEPSKYLIHGLQMRLKIMMRLEDHQVGVKVLPKVQEKILVHQLGDIKEQTLKVNSIMIIIKLKMIGAELK